MNDELRQAHKDGLDELVYSSSERGMNVAAESPDLTDEHVDFLLNHGSVHVALGLVYNHKLPEHHVDKFVNHRHPTVRYRVIKHPKATLKHIEQLTNDPASHVREAARQSLIYGRGL